MYTEKLSEFAQLGMRSGSCNEQFYKTSVQCSEEFLKTKQNKHPKPPYPQHYDTGITRKEDRREHISGIILTLYNSIMLLHF